MSEHTGLINSYQLLITAACTNIGGKMKGSRTRAADWCPCVPRYSKDRLPLSWLFRWNYTENLELSRCLFFRHWRHRVTITTTPVPPGTTKHPTDLNEYINCIPHIIMRSVSLKIPSFCENYFRK